MKAREKSRVATLRLVSAQIKQVEIDERRDLSNEDIESVLTKMIKQRRDSIEQFDKADRVDLSEKEKYEITIIEEFLPEQLSEKELDDLLSTIIEEEDIAGLKDMGRAMSVLKSNYVNRIDMGLASRLIKDKLS
jgi:hypothetical protein